MKKNIIFILMLISTFAFAGQWDNEESENKTKYVYIDSGFEYNFWTPYAADVLNYKTEGFKIFYVNGILKHKIPYLPVLKFEWFTNFNSENQDELLKIQNNETKLEQTYNKLKGVLGFDKHEKFIPKKKDDDDDSEGIKKDENNKYVFYTLEFSYMKETFFVNVTPKEDFNYIPYNSSQSQTTIYSGDKLSMFTKFEEFRVTFDTGGLMVLPAFINLLFGSSKDDDASKPLDVSGAFDTRLGFFYATYNKPFSINQISTSGETTGELNSIYDAKFKIFGIVEEVNSFPFEQYIFNYSTKLAFVSIDLTEDEMLEDWSAPMFLFVGFGVDLGFRFEMGKYVSLKVLGSGQYNFMIGTESETDENGETKLKSKSFINDDLLLKITAYLEIAI